MTSTRVLVTGATGFVGGHLTAFLAARGCDVHAVVRTESRLDRLRSIVPTVVAHRHDGSMESIIEIVRSAKPEVVLHLATTFVAEHQARDVVPMLTSNVVFATQLLEAMIRNGVDCLVNAGTLWQHYQNAPYRPANLYAATKQAFETLVTYYGDCHGVRAVTLKLCDTYGEQDSRRKLIPALIGAARSGLVLPMGSRDRRIELVHVADVVRALWVASERVRDLPAGGFESFRVWGDRCSLFEVVELFNRLSRRKVEVRWDALEHGPREMTESIDVLAPLPGWRPEFDLTSGLTRMLGVTAG